ncbi:NAD(P)/FAD-dependent oxidoreductase [Paraburkholderia caledonica]|uniref:Glycine/D-amino acid oxidase-like deaminating enzyme n=1 Tax=Paraburkholderia caledonica TaxID=134536 RepID=A0AB73IMR1_9BURK|nr:glycine/D-amino acid oxidase-like deaminating enzyme [Paraburkholderia caledonica]
MNDVVIVGAGAIGASIALFCKKLEPGLNVTVIDPDLNGGFSSTARSGSGGSRRLFCCPENIAMSEFSIAFFKELDAQAENEFARVNWQPQGYLFIVPHEGIDLLHENLRVQRQMGVKAEVLAPGEMKKRFPMLRVDDLGAGVFSPEDGWCDAQRYHAVVTGKAKAAGVQFMSDTVVNIDIEVGQFPEVELRSGRTLKTEFVVNAAGPWAADICELVGMPLPVFPMRRFEHIFTAETARPDMPYVKDVRGLAIRSAGSGYSGGLVKTNVPRGYSLKLDNNWFDQVVRPAVEWRFPGIGHLELTKSWSGLYEQCDFDGNAIIGRWTGHCDRFLVAAGFSGHGLMHAPAAGMAVAEMIVKGRQETLDLKRFGYERIQRNEPYRERGII